MKTAKQKIENWLDACGYVHGESFVVYRTSSGLWTNSRFKTQSYIGTTILSLTNPDGTVHLPPADLHEDDKPEPSLVQLATYIECHKGLTITPAMMEIYNLLKDLEAFKLKMEGGVG